MTSKEKINIVHNVIRTCTHYREQTGEQCTICPYKGNRPYGTLNCFVNNLDVSFIPKAWVITVRGNRIRQTAGSRHYVPDEVIDKTVHMYLKVLVG